MSGISNPPSEGYVPEEQQYKKYADGEYMTTGILWFTVDENKAPKFVDQKGQMVARCPACRGKYGGRNSLYGNEG